jgi:hypothetical protein
MVTCSRARSSSLSLSRPPPRRNPQTRWPSPRTDPARSRISISPARTALGPRATGVVFDFVPGTLLFEAGDPDGDDNGPGNYAYPTSDYFKPGAFDIQQFQVFDAGDRIIFRLRTRDLSPTFGSPLGAQLVDVYVHVPGAAQTSTHRRPGYGAQGDGRAHAGRDQPGRRAGLHLA